MRDQVTAEVVLSDRHLSDRGRTTLLRLTWLTRDPLAVSLMLTATPDHPSLPRGTWIVLRDFLRYGMEAPAGDGTVQISPDPPRDRIRLDLSRDCGTWWVTVPVDVLRWLPRRDRRAGTGWRGAQRGGTRPSCSSGCWPRADRPSGIASGTVPRVSRVPGDGMP